VALRIKMVDGGAVIFAHKRVGRHGRLFPCFKFRTMVANSAEVLAELLARDPAARAEWARDRKLRHDPRITAIGRFLRKTSLDELPQLLNVVRGEMSLVGPRPDVPGFADALTGADRIVLSVRPGITGPAALAFRHEESLLASVADPETYNREVIWPEKVRINREYVQNWSLAGDLRCLLGTVSSVLEPSPSVGGTPRE
jgi:lipopolysaccharide/colanic/teichoic acid biosynthesis glycosyltransferase